MTPATRAKAGSRQLTRKGLKERCTSLRMSLIEYRIVTADEIAPWWPGGAENPGRDYDAWIVCYAQLIGLNRVAQAKSDTLPGGRSDRDEQLAAAVAAAAMAQPEAITLSDGTVRHVHPKSFEALNLLEGCDQVVRRTQAAGARAIRDQLETLDDDAFALLHEHIARSRAVRCWAWVLTHQGAGLPWPEDSGALELPTWTAALAPEDLLVIDAAHRRVNGERLAIMAAAFPSQPGERSRLAIGGMLASYAHEHGRPPRDVMRLLSIGEVVAGAIATNEAHEVATRNAKQKRGGES